MDKALGGSTVYNYAKLNNSLRLKYIYENLKADYEVGDTLKFKGINRVYEKINNNQRKFLEKTINELKYKDLESDQEFYSIIEQIDNALGENTIYNKDNYITILCSRGESYEVEKKNTKLFSKKIWLPILMLDSLRITLE